MSRRGQRVYSWLARIAVGLFFFFFFVCGLCLCKCFPRHVFAIFWFMSEFSFLARIYICTQTANMSELESTNVHQTLNSIDKTALDHETV